MVKSKVAKLMAFEGMRRQDITEAAAGDIVVVSGIEEVTIGETLADLENPVALPPIAVDEPTVSMTFRVNDSPFAGREGKYVTSRNIGERLQKELRTNVAMRVEETDSPDAFRVSGRGELHLAILVETMRREGFEFALSRPQVILKEIDGVTSEPVEQLVVDVPEVSMGTVIEKLGQRKAEMTNMTNHGSGPREDRVQDPDARPLRLPQRVPDGHEGRGPPVPRLRRATSRSRATWPGGAWARSSARRRGRRPRTRSSGSRSVRRCSWRPASRSTAG